MADKKLKIKVSPTARIKGDKWTEYMKNIKKDKSGARAKKSSGGRIGLQGGGRTNLLEELGRVEAEPSNRNRRAEISRVHGELNRGYKSGGRTGLKHGGSAGAAKRGHGAEIK